MDNATKERFLSKISPEPNSGCWLWTAGLNSDGYSSFSIKSKTYRGHRLAYEMFRGPIPTGLTLDHLCRVRSCVNPDHLEAVTSLENIKRGKIGEINGARQKSRIHCKRGHLFEGDNLVIRSDGSRRCRTCINFLQRRAIRRRHSPDGWKQTRLKIKDVQEIRCLLAQGRTQKQIGDLFGVTGSSIYNISARKTWAMPE